ncbi:hypothetical protein ACI7YT_09110 [Microbacterium sp. M]|uniref:hypothetical protein n=1 Tax=Microbacterium sp. M TaxID=3377125 RepID=UPI00386FED4A
MSDLPKRAARIQLELNVVFDSEEDVVAAALAAFDEDPYMQTAEDNAAERQLIASGVEYALENLCDIWASVRQVGTVDVRSGSVYVHVLDGEAGSAASVLDTAEDEEWLADRARTTVVQQAVPADDGSAFDEKHLRGLARNLVGINWVLDAQADDDESPLERKHRKRQQKTLRGLLWHASVTMVDSLYSDLIELHSPGTSVTDTMVLSDLPAQFTAMYRPLFAQRFLVAMVDVTSQLASEWRGAPSVAHEIALSLLLDEVEALQDLHGIELPDDWREVLNDTLFQDTDFELLWSPRMDGIEDYGTTEMGYANLAVKDWFRPFGNVPPGAPYATDVSTDTAGTP